MLLQLKVDCAFAEDSDGLEAEDLQRVIAAHQREFAFCDEDEVASFAAREWESIQETSSRVLHRPLDREAFANWYTGFLSFLESERANPTSRPCGGAAAVSVIASGPYSSDGPWTASMTDMHDAFEAAWAKGRTPLLLDMSSFDEGSQHRSGEATPLETFFAYSGDKLIDLKKIVVEVDVNRERSLQSALEEMRAKLVLCMRRGYHLVLMLGNSAPHVRSRYTSDAHLPYVLLEDNAEVQRAIGHAGEDWRRVEWTRLLLTEADQIRVVHQDFNVLAITRFAPDKYEGFLRKELPLPSMQIIRVTRA